MSQTTNRPNRFISSAIWVEPDYLLVRLEMGSAGRIRFTIKHDAFDGTPLEGWRCDLPPELQWRATVERDEESGTEDIVWVSGDTGARLKETRLIDLLLIAREDMSDEARVETSSWTGKFIILEQGFHNFGVFDVLDDLALRVPVSRRQFNTRLALDEDHNIVLDSDSLDGRINLICKSSAIGIEYELHDNWGNDRSEPSRSGLWKVEDISREANDHGFHEAVDEFITLSPPPLAA